MEIILSIAMVLTKIAKRNPREIAQAIVDHLDTSKKHTLNRHYSEAITKVIDLDMQHNLRILTFY